MSYSKIVHSIILLYIITAVFQIYKSSLPQEPCIIHRSTHPKENGPSSHSPPRNHCLKPLLYATTELLTPTSISTHRDGTDDDKKPSQTSNSRLLLELHVPAFLLERYQSSVKNNGRGVHSEIHEEPRLTWTLVSSCMSHLPSTVSTGTSKDDNDKRYPYNQTEMTFSDILPTNDNGQEQPILFSPHSTIHKKCQLSFPNFSRIRSHNKQDTTLYKGRFTLKRIVVDGDGNTVANTATTIAQTVFDLTRIIENHKTQGEDRFVPYYKYYKQPLILRIVTDTQSYPRHNPIRGDGYVMERVMSTHPHRQGNYYYRPIFYVDEVALRHSSQIELAPSILLPNTNTTKPPVDLTVKITFITPLRHTLQQQLSLSINMAEQILRPNEVDEIKYLLSDEHMYRFCITQIIGFVHLSLDYLAFKNEIGFYVGRGKDVTGISLSSIYSRFACELIIFLYLIEGGNTSWFVLFSIGLSVGVEVWKLVKFLQPKLKMSWKFPFYIISVRDMSNFTSTEKETVNYDGIARTYLSLILYPLVLGMALYGRQFYEYTSWYSWTISNLANAVYTFGFISLCPQLYINYRLKSVAHMPWQVFVYKIFNTFVDDVFAFIVEMPMKHKIMTLRDDIVFVIFLIQAYLYRVDKKRANEFGYVYEVEEDEMKKKESELLLAGKEGEEENKNEQVHSHEERDGGGNGKSDKVVKVD